MGNSREMEQIENSMEMEQIDTDGKFQENVNGQVCLPPKTYFYHLNETE